MRLFGSGGEIQEAEVYLPIILHKYTMDLSRTRSYFVPGFPLDVVVCMKLTPWLAVDMTVTILYVKDVDCCYSRWS